LRKEHFVNNTGRTTLAFLAGLGIGAAIALLSAPRSGEETREWIADTAERKFKMLRRSGQRSMRHLQHTLAKGEKKLTDVLRDGKEAVALVATKLV
jgi:gas vesicle protein